MVDTSLLKSDALERESSNLSTDITWIYGLIDPRTREIFYIGKSDYPEARCADGYTNEAQDVINDLRSVSLKPEVQRLEYLVADKLIWKPREQYWIDICREWCYPIRNRNNGGGGPTKHSEETKKKIGAANRGRILPPVSLETRAKISRRARKFQTEETRQKLRESALARGSGRYIRSDEIRQKMRESARQRRLS